MKKTATKMEVSDEVREILQHLEWSGNIAKIKQALPRPLYVSVNEIMELAGGKWNRSAKGHVFTDGGQEKIATAIEEGVITDRKKALQFYETPAQVADLMVELLEPHSSHRILEPSCGKGALLRALNRGGVNKKQAVGIEIDKENAVACWKQGFYVDRSNFLEYIPAPQIPLYDRIIANPPFTGGQDIYHVSHMWRWLAPGGRIVAITSPSWQFRTSKAWVMFREFIREFGGTVRDLDAGTFKESGTNVRALLLVLNKPE